MNRQLASLLISYGENNPEELISVKGVRDTVNLSYRTLRVREYKYNVPRIVIKDKEYYMGADLKYILTHKRG